ncbi:hypothetical protein QR680_000790 [Steinernema hermaphroditum]|uniref:Uncharacterized protein n=1 Tax=Steinernema hermaphroditum TaxID=289476 RepID=A0AA39GVV3_9BILA|nr:hypothetical protein QR680_000790 [Steinernema hermaphroditum]
MTIHLALTCGSQREISNALPSNGVRTATVRFYRRQPCLWLNHYELLHQHAVVVNQRKVGFPAVEVTCSSVSAGIGPLAL